MEGFNLENIKKEIDARKSQNAVNEQAAGKVGQSPQAKKKFLVDLLTSVNNGTPTSAVYALNHINEATESKHGLATHGGKSIVNKGGVVNTYVPPTPMNETHQNINVQPQVERGESYFDQQMRIGQERLLNNAGQPVATPNAGLSQALNEYANAPYVGQNQQMMTGAGINANMLNEHVIKTMNEVMGGSNFTKIVAEAYKNMINEMYTKEKIEAALVEAFQGETFKKVIKKQIVDTLIEIQNRKKSDK